MMQMIIFIPFLLKKIIGVILTSLGFFYYILPTIENYGLSGLLSTHSIIGVLFMLGGQFIFWILCYNENVKWDYKI